MRNILHLSILLVSVHANAQSALEWNEGRPLQFSDFKSPSTQIGGTNMYSLRGGSSMDILFQMSNAEFMFTRNFNSKVSCSFNQSAASLVAPDSAMAMDLLQFARFEFDLCELYSRKFRKRLHEEKGAFSNADFFRPIFDEVQREYAERLTTAGKETDLGRNREWLNKLHQDALKEMEQLPDFCKPCKPPRTRN